MKGSLSVPTGLYTERKRPPSPSWSIRTALEPRGRVFPSHQKRCVAGGSRPASRPPPASPPIKPKPPKPPARPLLDEPLDDLLPLDDILGRIRDVRGTEL